MYVEERGLRDFGMRIAYNLDVLCPFSYSTFIPSQAWTLGAIDLVWLWVIPGLFSCFSSGWGGLLFTVFALVAEILIFTLTLTGCSCSGMPLFLNAPSPVSPVTLWRRALVPLVAGSPLFPAFGPWLSSAALA